MPLTNKNSNESKYTKLVLEYLENNFHPDFDSSWFQSKEGLLMAEPSGKGKVKVSYSFHRLGTPKFFVIDYLNLIIFMDEKIEKNLMKNRLIVQYVPVLDVKMTNIGEINS